MDTKESLGKNQIKDSMGLIDAAVRTTNAEIEALKLKNEKMQKQTRMEEEIRRQQRYDEILMEANSSGQKNQALEIKWSELKRYEESEELNRQIQDQNAVFKGIIKGKDKLITTFWDELKKKDDDYVKMLKEQSDDIKLMIEQMRKQFFQIRDDNLSELEKIEEEFNKDRDNLLQEFEDDLKERFSKHEKQIIQNVNEQIKKENEYFNKIQSNRIKDSKYYASKKITLENEIQNLEKCLEDMKALYTLNTEKLDYNLKVLKEKHEENQTLQEELKKKEMHLNNRLRKCTKHYIDEDKRFRKDNKAQTQEYKRITKQFKELQRKFKHFEKADSDKYKEIMKMNIDEVRKLKDKIVKCDVSIHLQQLGTEWVPVESTQEQENAQLSEQKTKIQGQSMMKEQSEEDIEENFTIGEPRIKEICDIIIKECDFLIDDRMRETLQTKPEDQQISARLETIKKCLGIDNMEEMNYFFTELIKDCRVKTIEELFPQLEEDKKKEEEKNQDKRKHKKDDIIKKVEEDVEDEIDLDNVELDENEIINYLIQWIENRDDRKIQLESKSTKKDQKVETERERKERIAKDGKKYWDELTQVLPERTFRVWKVLDKSLSKYYELLQGRQKLIEETGDLHNQNEELKNLLNQYLQINHELIIPPTRLINLEPNQ